MAKHKKGTPSKADLEREMERLCTEFDINDYPDDQVPQDAREANLIYCALRRLLEEK